MIVAESATHLVHDYLKLPNTLFMVQARHPFWQLSQFKVYGLNIYPSAHEPMQVFGEPVGVAEDIQVLHYIIGFPLASATVSQVAHPRLFGHETHYPVFP